MCEPTTIAMMALTVASAGASMMSQSQMADDQAAANERQRVANEKGRAFNIQQVMAQKTEDYDEALGAKEDASIEAAKAKATARVASGEAGLALDSNSVQAMIGDFSRQQGKNEAQIDDNLNRMNQQRNKEITGIHLQADSKNAQLVAPPTPDYLGTALAAGGKMFGQYQSMKIDKPDIQKPDLTNYRSIDWA